MKKRILFIAYYFPPLGMGGTQRIAKWCKYLVRTGWQVSVITVKPISYYAYDDSLLQDIAGVKVIRTPSLDPARVLRLLAPNRNGERTGSRPPRFGSLLNWVLVPDPKILWLPFACYFAWREIRRARIPFVITSGPPHSSHFAGLLLKKLLKIAWISDFRDGWSHGDFLQTPTKMHEYLHRRAERMIVRAADAVISVSEGLADYFHRTVGKARERIYFVPNGYDHEDFAVATASPDDRFDVTFVGAITPLANPQTLLAGFHRFVETAMISPEQAKLHLVGADLTGATAEPGDHHSLAAYLNLTGYLPHREAVAYLRNADLLVYICHHSAPVHHIPGKTFEYLAAVKPVLLIGDQTEGAQILSRHRPYRHCDFEDTGAIARALLAFYKEYVTGSLSIPPEELAEFSRAQQTRQLESILESVGVAVVGQNAAIEE